jgi:hypothetical protein
VKIYPKLCRPRGTQASTVRACDIRLGVCYLDATTHGHKTVLRQWRFNAEKLKIGSGLPGAPESRLEIF